MIERMNKIKRFHNISPKLLKIQLLLFTLLYSVWLLPSTILIRNITLIVGAIISVTTLLFYYNKFKTRQLIPFFAIILVFMWVIVRLFFFPTNYDLQYQELHRIWIRVALASIFAFGFGILISQFKIGLGIILGLNLILAMPSFIFLIKLLLTSLENTFNIIIPEAFTVTYDDSKFYIPKTSYVSFCIPSIATSVVSIYHYCHEYKKNALIILVLAFILLANFLTFESINTKNGIIFGSFIVMFFLAKSILLSKFRKISTFELRVKFLAVFIFLIFVGQHIYQNQSWLSLISDIKVGVEIDKYQNWKNGVNGILPISESGKKVYGTNYERTAWFIAGVDLLSENPLGYGVVESSFGQLAKIKWPESKLHQTHSGWLDLALGIGIPGVSLLLTALFFSLKQSHVIKNNLLTTISFWILVSTSLIWTTTELSQKVYIDTLFFWIMFSSGIGIGFSKKLNEFE